LLHKSQRGKYYNPNAFPEKYGQEEVADGVAGVELLEAYENGDIQIDEDGEIVPFVAPHEIDFCRQGKCSGSPMRSREVTTKKKILTEAILPNWWSTMRMTRKRGVMTPMARKKKKMKKKAATKMAGKIAAKALEKERARAMPTVRMARAKERVTKMNGSPAVTMTKRRKRKTTRKLLSSSLFPLSRECDSTSGGS
jgi:hypothetical protein